MDPSAALNSPPASDPLREPDPHLASPEAPHSRTSYALAALALTLACFILDFFLPLTATPSIGYCLVLLLALAARSPRFLLVMALTSTLLTWIGIFFEPAEALWFMLAFDRLMITLILWIIYALLARRARTTAELARQNREFQRLTLELARSNAELASFASVIAHDLRSPLNTIGLFAQILDDRRLCAQPPERYDALDAIHREIARMNSLIQSLLSYARVGSGELHTSPCDLQTLLDAVRQHLKAEFDRTSASLTSDPLPTLPCDPTLLSQLFQNIIENALKYRSPDPPRIHVSASPLPHAWQFSIRDNGRGIAPDDAPHIFEPFHQAPHTRSAHNGVGLGLATCKKIVERHHGHIWASPSPPHGTTFFFTLPKS